ncbi:hypothetical protein BDN72DRAFT_833504 [Pluteus cervinus]|uniref:Uncharacterized protein n=1 Tax=Pluteus cervinus TaxID=181527 RepID=A0ACD3B9J7_9AGAR|nr:hypothetical protein BDN72DRAFT_833504 [Pluteus cervinus]
MDPECGDERCLGCRRTTVTASELGIRDIEDAAYKVQLQPNIKTLMELAKSWNRWKHRGGVPPESEMAMLCLYSLHLLGSTLVNNVDEAARHEQDFVDIWPVILKWIMIVFSSRLRGRGHDSPSLTLFEEEAANTIARALFVLALIPALRYVMAATPGLLEVAASLWLLEGITEPHGPVAIASTLINCFLDNLEDATPILTRLMNAAGGDPDIVLRIACSRIQQRLTLEIPRIEAERILDNLMILASSASAKPKGYRMRQACVQVDVIPTCIAALKWTAAMIKAKGPHSFLSRMIYPAFSCIHDCLEIGSGYSEVLQAVRCGLIQVFMECRAEFSSWSSDQRNNIFEIFRSIIPRYLVYRPVTKATYPVLSRLVGDTSSCLTEDYPVYEVLVQLHKLALEYHSPIAKSRTARILCDNWKCSENRFKSDFFTCSACHFAWYCSRECQKADWRAGSCHKRICPTLRRAYLEHSPNAAFRDKRWIHGLCYYLVRSVMPNLPDIIKEKHPSASLSSLLVLINFQEVPVGCSILSKEEIAATMKEEPVEEDVLVFLLLALESAKWRKHHLLVVSTMDLGEDGRAWTMQQTFLDLRRWDEVH